MLVRLSCLVVCFWCATLASGRDIFVDNRTGDDRANGRNARSITIDDGPVRSIAKALRLAERGDRVVLAASPVPYRESVSLTSSKHSGWPDYPFVVEGNGAVLDGSELIPHQQWQNFDGDTFSYQPRGLGYQQLFVAGRAALRRPTSPADYTVPALAAGQWSFSGGRIFFAVEPGRVPADYELACCALPSGITLYHVHHLVIRNLVVQGFQFDGIAANDVVREARLERVTSRANGRSGVSVAGASLVELAGCRLEGNGQSQLRSENYAQTYLRESKLTGDTAPAIVAVGGRVTDLPPLTTGPPTESRP